MAEWIDTEEAAQLSGYNIIYLRVLLREKKIAGKKRGGAYWVDKQSLFAYISTAKDSGDGRHGARGKAPTNHSAT